MFFERLRYIFNYYYYYYFIFSGIHDLTLMFGTNEAMQGKGKPPCSSHTSLCSHLLTNIIHPFSLSLSLSKNKTNKQTFIVLSDQQLFLQVDCAAGLYFTSSSDVAVSGKNHYNKQVDIPML